MYVCELDKEFIVFFVLKWLAWNLKVSGKTLVGKLLSGIITFRVHFFKLMVLTFEY